MGTNNMRLFVWMSFFAMMWFTYRAWLIDYPPATVVVPLELAQDDGGSQPPQLFPDTASNTPPALNQPDPTPVLSLGDALVPGSIIRVRTDVLDVTIDLLGGDIVRADLPRYPVDKDSPDSPVRLLDYESETRCVFESGFTSIADDDEPNHLATFVSDRREYALGDSDEELVVTLDWQSLGTLS